MLQIEVIASFVITLSIYFLGSLAVVQEVIRPQKQLVVEGNPKKKHWVTNYQKIFFLSFVISLPITCLAIYLFV